MKRFAIKFLTYIKYYKYLEDFGVVVKNSKLGDVVLGKETFVLNSKLGDDVFINANTKIFNSIINNNIRIGKNCTLNNSTLENNSYLASNCVFNRVEIGRFCSISSNVISGLGAHPISFISTSPVFYSKKSNLPKNYSHINCFEEYSLKKTIIGNDVWVGVNSYIKDGVTIGDGAIIGAGSVVIKDVPPYAIVGGVPSKILNYRHNPEIIDFLLKLKWWYKSDDWLRKNINFFQYEITQLSEIEHLSSD